MITLLILPKNRPNVTLMIFKCRKIIMQFENNSLSHCFPLAFADEETCERNWLILLLCTGILGVMYCGHQQHHCYYHHYKHHQQHHHRHQYQ